MLRGVRFAPLVSLRYARVRALRALGGSSSQKWEPVNPTNLTLPPQGGFGSINPSLKLWGLTAGGGITLGMNAAPQGASGREDLNLRPPRPERGALPG